MKHLPAVILAFWATAAFALNPSSGSVSNGLLNLYFDEGQTMYLTNTAVGTFKRPVAAFTAWPTNPANTYAPVTISFTNWTAGLFTNLQVNFMDGTTNNYNYNVGSFTHLYNVGFTGTPTMTAFGLNGTNTFTLPATIALSSLSTSNWALQFTNAASTSAVIPASAAWALQPPYTIECWFSNACAIGNMNNALKTGWYFVNTPGTKVTYQYYYNSGSEPNVQYGAGQTNVANQWCHLALVHNGTTMTFYMNGTSLVAAATSTGLTNGAANPLKIGNDVTNYGSLGTAGAAMDEVRICTSAVYSTSFTPATTLGTNASTIAYYTFGDGLSNGGTNVIDHSYNGGHNGAFTNGGAPPMFITPGEGAGTQ